VWHTGQLQDTVEAEGVRGGAVNQASGSLQVGGHLVLDLQLGHPAPRLQVVEVDQLIRLRLRLRLLMGPAVEMVIRIGRVCRVWESFPQCSRQASAG
jgi:hypothetical protein